MPSHSNLFLTLFGDPNSFSLMCLCCYVVCMYVNYIEVMDNNIKYRHLFLTLLSDHRTILTASAAGPTLFVLLCWPSLYRGIMANIINKHVHAWACPVVCGG